MALGTKNRLHETGVACKAHLREQHADKLGLVAEFIAEIEGAGSKQDLAAWNQFTDLRRAPAEMLQRVEAAFQTWLAGG
jgi:hypothetical protein